VNTGRNITDGRLQGYDIMVRPQTGTGNCGFFDRMITDFLITAEENALNNFARGLIIATIAS